MPWNPTKSAGGDFKPVPVGVHPAVCSAVVDIGVQPQTNPAYKPTRKLVLSWQLPVTLTDAGKPMTISATFTESMNKKANLRKFIENWFGKSFPNDKAAESFDYSALLGRACMVNVVHKDGKEGKVFANVSAALPLMAGVEKPALPKDQQIYYAPKDPTITADQLSAAYVALPEWLKKKIEQQVPPVESDGVAGDVQQEAAAQAAGDDIPF